MTVNVIFSKSLYSGEKHKEATLCFNSISRPNIKTKQNKIKPAYIYPKGEPAMQPACEKPFKMRVRNISNQYEKSFA